MTICVADYTSSVDANHYFIVQRERSAGSPHATFLGTGGGRLPPATRGYQATGIPAATFHLSLPARISSILPVAYLRHLRVLHLRVLHLNEHCKAERVPGHLPERASSSGARLNFDATSKADQHPPLIFLCRPVSCVADGSFIRERPQRAGQCRWGKHLSQHLSLCGLCGVEELRNIGLPRRHQPDLFPNAAWAIDGAGQLSHGTQTRAQADYRLESKEQSLLPGLPGWRQSLPERLRTGQERAQDLQHRPQDRIRVRRGERRLHIYVPHWSMDLRGAAFVLRTFVKLGAVAWLRWRRPWLHP